MKVKDIKKRLNLEMEAIVPDVLANVKKASLINMLPNASQEQIFRQKLVMRMLFATCCVFFSVLIVTASFFLSQFFKAPESASVTYMHIYAAPSYSAELDPLLYNAFELDLIVNLDGTVSVMTLDSGANAVEGINFRNKKLKDVLFLVMDKAYEMNLFNNGDSTSISMSALNTIEDAARQILNEQSAYLKDYFRAKSRTVDVGQGKAEKSAFAAWAKSVNETANSDMDIDQLASIIETWYLTKS